jgi:dipeptidase E
MGLRVGQGFVSRSPVTPGDDRTLGLVDFAMFPHLNHEAMPDHSMVAAELWAARLPVPAYAIDDETAIKVVGSTVEVVSEGQWKLLSR